MSRRSVCDVGASSSKREPEPKEKEFGSVDEESEEENVQKNYRCNEEEKEEFELGDEENDE